MRTSSRLLVSIRRVALCATIVTAAVLGAPPNLMAHARLVKSEPAAASKGPAPSQIRLTFSEELIAAMSRVLVITPRGDTVNAPPQLDSADAHVLRLDLHGYDQPGSYTVKWAVAARDGHPSHGSFSFVVTAREALDTVKHGAPAMSSTLPAAAVETLPRDSATGVSMVADNSIGMIVVRWIAFISTFLVVGAVTFRLVLLRKIGADDADAFTEIASANAATVGLVASVGMLVSLILRIVRESADMPEVSTRAMLLSSGWGWCICCALIAAFAGVVAFVRAGSRSGTASLQAWRIALVAAVALVVTPAFSGHAIGSDWAWITVPNDVVHVAAGSVWLGTLAVILIVGISAALKAHDSAQARARIAQMINAFSPIALTCGAIVVASGIIASLFHLPRVNALWTTPYGSALYRKLIFVLLLFGVGAWNWRRTKPRLHANENGLASLRKAAMVEILIAVVVLGLTAILVALALPE